MRWGLLLLLACASQRSAESHADYAAQTEQTTTRGPVRVTTTVREFGGTHGINPSTRGAYNSSSAPVLVREVVRVTDRAPVVVQTTAGTQVHADAESASSRRFGPGFWGWFAMAAGAVAAGLLAWKFRAGLLGGVLKLIGR